MDAGVSEDFQRHVSALIVVQHIYPEIMKEMINNKWPSPLVDSLLNSESGQCLVKTFSAEQQNRVESIRTEGYKGLDTELMYKIIRHFGLVNKPSDGWGKKPKPNGNTQGDDIERMRYKRNDVVHRPRLSLTEEEFDNFFTGSIEIAKRMDINLGRPINGFQKKIENVKYLTLSSDMGDPYLANTAEYQASLTLNSNRQLNVYFGEDIKLRVENGRNENKSIQCVLYVRDPRIKIASEIVELLDEAKQQINDGKCKIHLLSIEEGSIIIHVIVNQVWKDLQCLHEELTLLFNCIFEVDNIDNKFGQQIDVVLAETDHTCIEDQCYECEPVMSQPDFKTMTLLKMNVDVQSSLFQNVQTLYSEVDCFVNSFSKCVDMSHRNGLFMDVVITENPTNERNNQQPDLPNIKLNQSLPKEENIISQPMRQATYNLGNTDEKSNEILGQPYSTEIKSDSILLQWRSEYNLDENETYQIIYKEIPNGKWKTYSDNESCKSARMVVDGLKSDTSYRFKVRIINDSSGEGGPFTKESDIVQTRQSPVLGILKSAQLIDHGPPKVYQLPIKENISGRNNIAKTRKFFLGREGGSDTNERTIMIVGAIGSGKSTLINGMANYIMGVTWEDPFRFTLINLETCEQEMEHDQAHSQTEWVTCYTLHNTISDRVNFSVNIIDTPGFGDSRGLAQDEKIIDQIRELFTTTGEKGVATLDALCFILKAPDVRLTATQKYMFESILSLFGNDIKDNICTLITFADGQRPPVLSAIQALDGIPLPYQTYFTFNNSALYVDNTTNIAYNLSSLFWDMGTKSCKTFFDHINKMYTKSLTLTSEVLSERHKLENTVKNLQQEIQVGLSKINILEKEMDLFTRNAEAILANQNFEYEVEEDYQEKIDLTGEGQYMTNCLTCNYTCHEDCSFDSDKARCIAINSEVKCIQSPKACHWSQHQNTPYIIKWLKRKVTKRYDDAKRKYEEASQRNLTPEQVLEEMSQDITEQEQAIQVMLEIIAKLNNRLKEIALRPDPMSTVQYIDLMIDNEKRQKKSGFKTRIDTLEKCKQRSTYDESVQIFKDRVSKTRMTTAAGDIADEILKDENSILGRIKGLLGYIKKN